MAYFFGALKPMVEKQWGGGTQSTDMKVTWGFSAHKKSSS